MIIKNTAGTTIKVARPDIGQRSRQGADNTHKTRLCVLACEGKHTYYWVRDTLRHDVGTHNTGTHISPYWINTYNNLFKKWRE